MIVGEYPETPLEIEVYADGSGVLRTVFGWFPIARFGAKTDSLHFEVDTTGEVPPSGVDREIIERARTILSAETAWNRADDRQCPADARTWSIYCSLVKATIEVAGAFHHRRPALQVVREIVDERTAGRPYEHRLMDYNNDPSSGLNEIRSLFSEALRRIEMAAQRGSISDAESNHSTQESD